MKTNYIKLTQKDYSLSLKFQIVQSIERGGLSIIQATKMYGIQCRNTIKLTEKQFNIPIRKNF
jgi:transposase